SNLFNFISILLSLRLSTAFALAIFLLTISLALSIFSFIFLILLFLDAYIALTVFMFSLNFAIFCWVFKVFNSFRFAFISDADTLYFSHVASSSFMALS